MQKGKGHGIYTKFHKIGMLSTYIPTETGSMGLSAQLHCAPRRARPEARMLETNLHQPYTLASCKAYLSPSDCVGRQSTGYGKKQDLNRRASCESRGRVTYRHTPKPTARVLRLREQLKNRHGAIPVQLRREKIGLRDFLFCQKAPNISDLKCQCGEGNQTVAHILLRCRNYRDLRQ